jgi:hypothetical protein
MHRRWQAARCMRWIQVPLYTLDFVLQLAWIQRLVVSGRYNNLASDDLRLFFRQRM